MAEAYCGKTCAECAQKEALSCPGCKAGPGKQYGGDCKLAKCCIEKGHQDCSTCGYNGHCGMLRGRNQVPDDRLKAMEAAKARAAEIAKRAPILGKWLWILFWLIIPATVASLMTNETIVEVFPSIFIPGAILRAICSLTYGLILLKLGAEEAQYRTAGICTLIGGAASVLIAFISGGAETPNWTLLISLPAAVVALVGEYHEFNAHSAVLFELDGMLCEKWCSLWKWYIGAYGALIGSIVLLLIAPILGLLVMLAAAIGIAVVGIAKLVYLYRTAKLFKEYRVEVGKYQLYAMYTKGEKTYGE